MQSAIPGWLTPVAWTYLALSLLSTAVIAGDIYLGRRRHVRIASELVWISTGLYLGPFAIPAYLRRGRTTTTSRTTALADAPQGTADPAVAVLPGGGASAVAHLVAVPFVAGVGWSIAGVAMWPMILVIALLVTVILAVFERTSGGITAPGHAHRVSLGAAIGVALVTLVAFDVGMVGWMLLLHVNNAMPPVTAGTFWFLMQIGVIIGLVTGYPAVAWLLRRNREVVPA